MCNILPVTRCCQWRGARQMAHQVQRIDAAVSGRAGRGPRNLMPQNLGVQARERVKWAEVAAVKAELDSQVAALLGPKTEADVAAAAAPKKKVIAFLARARGARRALGPPLCDVSKGTLESAARVGWRWAACPTTCGVLHRPLQRVCLAPPIAAASLEVVPHRRPSRPKQQSLLQRRQRRRQNLRKRRSPPGATATPSPFCRGRRPTTWCDILRAPHSGGGNGDVCDHPCARS